MNKEARKQYDLACKFIGKSSTKWGEDHKVVDVFYIDEATQNDYSNLLSFSVQDAIKKRGWSVALFGDGFALDSYEILDDETTLNLEEEKPKFKDVKEGQLFINVYGDLCQKSFNCSYNTIAKKDGSLYCRKITLGPDEYIEKILTIEKIKFK